MSFFSKVETAFSTASSDQTYTGLGDKAFDTVLTPLPEREFRRLLCRERKRSERSRKNFLLMLVRQKETRRQSNGRLAMSRVARALGASVRETDTLGWFESNSVVGVIFSEIGNAPLNAAVESIQAKAFAALQKLLDVSQFADLQISFYSFPQGWEDGGNAPRLDPVLYPDLADLDESRRSSLFFKRVLDIVGSAFALILLSPVFAILAVLIKLTSKGPVFFKQERLGQFQVRFAFLKFRSMRVATNQDIHIQYVKNYIAGRAEPRARDGNRRVVYKLTNDPRVTSVGKFMRRTSLDEIPQFWNVLMGQMSLVGPRPPIRYEIEAYDVWHRRRLHEAKPGITGLWQVHGRSRTTFDEMVRLDLRYSKTCSISSDLKILLQTPRAVLSGDGAY